LALVRSFVRTDQVVLADGPFDGKGVIGDVAGEGPVRPVQLSGMWASVHSEGKFNFGYHECTYPSGFPNRLIARHEDRGLAAVVGK
jgi:hypothetical protein